MAIRPGQGCICSSCGIGNRFQTVYIFWHEVWQVFSFPNFKTNKLWSVLPCASTGDAALIQSYINAYAGNSNQLYYRGKQVVSTFSGENCLFGQSDLNSAWTYALQKGELSTVSKLMAICFDYFMFLRARLYSCLHSSSIPPDSVVSPFWMVFLMCVYIHEPFALPLICLYSGMVPGRWVTPTRVGILLGLRYWGFGRWLIFQFQDAAYRNAIGNKFYMASVSPVFFTVSRKSPVVDCSDFFLLALWRTILQQEFYLSKVILFTDKENSVNWRVESDDWLYATRWEILIAHQSATDIVQVG